MIEYFVLLIIFFYFIISSIEDIKKREVYDYINFSLSFFILAIAIFDSLLKNSIDPIKYVGFGFLIGFAFGSILYYLGIWGGGDAKFLIGFSASSYYLINIISSKYTVNIFYDRSIDILSIFFTMFLDNFLNFILFFDFIFLLIIVISRIFFVEKNKNDRSNSFYLFFILLLMFLGLYYNYSNLTLVILGFIVFILIFFSKEDLFLSVYFKIKRNVLDLKEENKITSNIEYKNEIIVDYENSKFGVSKEDIINIKEKVDIGFDIYVKKIFPLSILISLNYLVYLFKIINLDKINLQILFFLFEFLFYSFICGGILSIFLIFYYYFKNKHKIKFSLKNKEKLIIIFSSLITLLFSIIYSRFLFLFVIIIFYIFLKLAKEVEKFMFIKKKNINDIVLGDWIAQDINFKGNLIYSIEEFKLGVNEIQLEKIKSLAKVSNNLKNIYVKDGIAFIPPLFVGFLIMLI